MISFKNEVGMDEILCCPFTHTPGQANLDVFDVRVDVSTDL